MRRPGPLTSAGPVPMLPTEHGAYRGRVADEEVGVTSCTGCVCGDVGPDDARSADGRTLTGSGSAQPTRALVGVPVGHLVRTATSVAKAHGLAVESLGGSLWQWTGNRVVEAVSALRGTVSPVEAAGIRILLDDGTGDDRTVLAASMLAPTLAEAGAQLDGGDLWSMFTTEASSFRSSYQPIVTAADRVVVAFEALLRARDSDGVEHPPGPLFAQAERAGWSPRLDRIARTAALSGAQGWLGDRQLFINFVPTSIYDPRVCLATTERAADRAGVDLRQIVFEVTESERIGDLAHLERVFDHYREKGARVALDDLGSGWSSLTVLARLEPDVVKLDRALVNDLTPAATRAVIGAVVDITHSYGGLVLAEGVETETEADVMVELGVDLAQGWLYGRPAFPPEPALAG